MMRVALIALGGAVLVTGCLFPSFDDMRGAGNGGGNRGSIAAKSETEVIESPKGADAATIDATSEEPTKAQAAIACEPDAGVCPGDGQKFCCATIGGPKCQDPGTEGFCTGIEGGKILRCDDDDDCPASANVCCFLAGEKEAACTTSCAGANLCTKDNPKCPAGKSCTGVITHGGGFTSSFCQ